jgi:hypothetical protein
MKKNIILIPTKIEAQLVDKKDHIVISGITTRTLKKIKTIHESTPVSKAVLIGFAGRLDDTLEINGTYNITEVTNGVHHLSLAAINKKWDSVSLITVKKPVVTVNRKMELDKLAQLVDMESFYFIEYCLLNNITPYAVRIISDNCDVELVDFFKASSFKEAKVALQKAVRTIEQQLAL